MMQSVKRLRFGLLALMLVGSTARADAPGFYAITNGTVHTVSGADIASGTVLIRDGLIEAVGANLAIPPEATVIDASGRHVYPGLFDAQTSLGFSSTKSIDPNAAFVAAENLEVTESDLDARRSRGVTTIVTAPRAGIFNGQSAVLNLGSGPAASRVVRSPAAFQISFNTRPSGTYPTSPMGVVAHIRQTFLDAQQQAAARTIYDRAPAGQRRPDIDPTIDALVPAIRRELPVVFVADTEQMIRRARGLASEANVRAVISGARQGYRLGAELKDTPVLVSVDWPDAPARREDREEQPLRVIRDRQLAPTTPAVLAKNGIQFALVSATAKASAYLSGIRKAITNGLAPADALRAVTLTPARIFGVDRQLGSLDRGKIANIIITDKPIFEKSAKVSRMFIDGREVRLQEARSAALDSPINGVWNLSVRTPQGDITIIVTLEAESGHVSGTFSGDKGSGDISGGIFNKPALQFTISTQGDGEASDWIFRGTITDDTIEGTVSTSLGAFPFTGSRPQ